MKHFALLLMAMLCSIVASAQASLVATLTHGNEVTSFYSSNALKEAYAVAADGDVITLSPGTFTATDFKTKKVTVRGAGMMLDSNPTIISGTTRIDIPQTDDNKDFQMVFEGLYFPESILYSNIIDFSFTKCYIAHGFQSTGTSKLDNGRFIHCILDNAYLSKGSHTYVSCVVRGGSYGAGTQSFFNCDIINCTNYGKSYNNCLFVIPDKSILGSVTTEMNCYYVGPSDDFFSNMPYAPNVTLPADTPVFKDGPDNYELLDENAATWLGADGTQVGIYGGSLPFDPTTSNPKITKFNVAPKTTADGKLSVDIEIQAL